MDSYVSVYVCICMSMLYRSMLLFMYDVDTEALCLRSSATLHYVTLSICLIISK